MAPSLLRPPSPPSGRPPRHPYRDAALFHGALGGVIVIVAWLTGADLAKSIGIAAAYFVAATLWSWWRFRERARLLQTPEDDR